MWPGCGCGCVVTVTTSLVASWSAARSSTMSTIRARFVHAQTRSAEDHARPRGARQRQQCPEVGVHGDDHPIVRCVPW